MHTAFSSKGGPYQTVYQWPQGIQYLLDDSDESFLLPSSIVARIGSRQYVARPSFEHFQSIKRTVASAITSCGYVCTVPWCMLLMGFSHLLLKKANRVLANSNVSITGMDIETYMAFRGQYDALAIFSAEIYTIAAVNNHQPWLFQLLHNKMVSVCALVQNMHTEMGKVLAGEDAATARTAVFVPATEQELWESRNTACTYLV